MLGLFFFVIFNDKASLARFFRYVNTCINFIGLHFERLGGPGCLVFNTYLPRQLPIVFNGLHFSTFTWAFRLFGRLLSSVGSIQINSGPKADGIKWNGELHVKIYRYSYSKKHKWCSENFMCELICSKYLAITGFSRVMVFGFETTKGNIWGSFEITKKNTLNQPYFSLFLIFDMGE